MLPDWFGIVSSVASCFVPKCAHRAYIDQCNIAKSRGYSRDRRKRLREEKQRAGNIPKDQRDGTVYFVADCSGRVKIGVTGRDVAERVNALQEGNADPLTLLATMSGGWPLEAELHARFAHYRLRGEWFWFTSEIAHYIETRGQLSA